MVFTLKANRCSAIIFLLAFLTVSPISAAERKKLTNASQYSLSTLLITPLFSENTFDKRFSAWGVEILGSFDLTRWEKSVLALEVGLGFTGTKLTLSQPATSFTHFFIFAPIRARFLVPLNQKWTLELSAGFLVRPWEYDSRDTVDGGFHRVTQTNTIEPDANLGFLYAFNRATSIRLRVGYRFLGAGLEFAL